MKTLWNYFYRKILVVKIYLPSRRVNLVVFKTKGKTKEFQLINSERALVIFTIPLFLNSRSRHTRKTIYIHHASVVESNYSIGKYLTSLTKLPKYWTREYSIFPKTFVFTKFCQVTCDPSDSRSKGFKTTVPTNVRCSHLSSS